MKKNKIIYWTATLFIVLLEGVIPALTSHTELAREGTRHLGYPLYFAAMLAVFKAVGALALVLPQVSRRVKEWAYAGFAFDFIAAAVSNWVVDGFGFNVIFPLIIMAILSVSYIFLGKIKGESIITSYASNGSY